MNAKFVAPFIGLCCSTLVWGNSIQLHNPGSSLHYDGWKYNYTPSAGGWSGGLVGGNINDSGGAFFTVFSNDLFLGQPIDLLLTFNVRLSATLLGFSPDGVVFGTAGYPSVTLAEWENFAGIGSAIVSAELLGQNLTAVFSENGFGIAEFEYLVTWNGIVGENYINYTLANQHVLFGAEGASVFDASMPAGFVVESAGYVTLAKIEFANVPEGGVTGILLSLALGSLAAVRIRRTIPRRFS